MSRLRQLVWPLVIIALAATFYGVARLKRDYVDFEVYQTAGARVLSAEPLYRTEDLHYQFKYLPAFAIAMIPLAPIEPEVAKAIWFALSVGLLMLFVDRSVQALPDRRCAVMTLKWLTALLIGKFVVKELVNGQSNVLLGVLLVSALVATQQDRRRLAGVLVGLAVFVKPYAILLLPWLAVTQGIAALLAAGTVLAAGLVLPAALYGWSGNLHLLAEWYRTVTGTTPENLLFPENISFATMWAKWLGPGRAASAWAVATSVAALGLAAGVWFKRKHVREPNYLEISLLMLLVPLLSPQGWDYVLILATPAIVLLVDRWRDMPAAWRTVTMAALALTSFSIFDLVGRAMYWRLMNLSVISVGAIALAASLARLRWRGLA